MDATFKTVWLSDVHLGSRACRVQLLLDFLRQTRCDTLYLVGDIIDLESLRESFFWPTAHTEVLRVLLNKSQEGTRVVYIPGNHDDDMRALVDTRIGNVEVLGRCIHTTAAGKRLLVPARRRVRCPDQARFPVGARRLRRVSQLAQLESLRALAARALGSSVLVARAARQDEDRQRAALHRDVPPSVAAGGRNGRRRRHRLWAHS